MKRRLLLQTVLVMLVTCCWAQGPNGSGTYYKNADGYTGSALKTALSGIISSHRNIGYDGLWEAYKKTDTRADGHVRDWYSNATNYTHITDKAGSYKDEGDCYNREHTIPQSWFEGCSEQAKIKADIIHVVPTDGKINQERGNDPFGEVSSITGQSKNGYSKWGPNKLSGYSGRVFEPNDEIKGDLARAYFYMATCYETVAASWGNGVFSTAYDGFEKWTLDMLMRWSKQDPVDEIEIARNNAVARTDVQNNRNPFVDYPGLEDYIWGDLKGQPFSYDNYGGDASFVAMPTFQPDAGSYYDQVEVTINCATDGADIYYTTDGSNPTANSQQYSSPFMLTETATVKAIAMTGDGQSAVASATYIIKTSGGEQGDGVAQLNNSFFGVTETGTIAKSNTTDLVGTVGGATVTYALGSGGQRYVGTDHIRVYAGNEVIVAVPAGALTSIQFEEKDNSGKTLQANTGTVSGLTWTGDASQVTFTVSSGSGHMKMTSISVTTSGGTGIDYVLKPLSGQRVVYNLRGERVANPTRGLYIVDGRKIVILR